MRRDGRGEKPEPEPEPEEGGPTFGQPNGATRPRKSQKPEAKQGVVWTSAQGGRRGSLGLDSSVENVLETSSSSSSSSASLRTIVVVDDQEESSKSRRLRGEQSRSTSIIGDRSRVLAVSPTILRPDYARLLPVWRRLSPLIGSVVVC